MPKQSSLLKKCAHKFVFQRNAPDLPTQIKNKMCACKFAQKTALIYWPNSFVVRDMLEVVDSMGNVYAGGPSHHRNR